MTHLSACMGTCLTVFTTSCWWEAFPQAGFKWRLSITSAFLPGKLVWSSKRQQSRQAAGKKASLGCIPVLLAWSPPPKVWRSSQQTASGGTAQSHSSLHTTSKMEKNITEKSKSQNYGSRNSRAEERVRRMTRAKMLQALGTVVLKQALQEQIATQCKKHGAIKH